MVRYTGRQKTITGAVNRNQVGLKMSGCPSRVGRSGKNIRLLGRRVNCMYGLCGPTMVNGAPWRTSGRNEPPYCRQRSTSCAQAAGGVGHINSPYTRTRVPAAGQQGCTQVNVGASTPWWYNNSAVLAAIAALTSYFASIGLNFALVGESETIATDIGPVLPTPGEHIFHYEAGRPAPNLLYNNLTPELKSAVDLINSINFRYSVSLNGPAVVMRHICGAVTDAGQTALDSHYPSAHYGVPQYFSKYVFVVAYASTCFIPNSTLANGTFIEFAAISNTHADPCDIIYDQKQIYKATSDALFCFKGDACTNTNCCTALWSDPGFNACYYYINVDPVTTVAQAVWAYKLTAECNNTAKNPYGHPIYTVAYPAS